MEGFGVRLQFIAVPTAFRPSCSQDKPSFGFQGRYEKMPVALGLR